MDHHMPAGINGPTAISEIKKIAPNQQVVTFSLDDTRAVMRENFVAGAVDVLDKNMDNETFLKEIANRCAKYEQFYRTIRTGNIKSDEKIKFISDTHMIGASDSTYGLCKEIQKIAPSDATVLVLGESGTGKELVAQAIHKCSRRSKGPFVAINIAAENASLLDSSLFGHRKGSFTGATEDYPGKFRLAEGGTIFLDEIGDMSLELQVKLLRVIQEREVYPIGATRPVSVNVRIIAATHRNLEKMIKEGTFREDLYYRINTMILNPAPLRERPDDIEILVGHFTEEFCKQYNFRKRFGQQCLEILRKHHWKANVRGLQSAVERHLIKCESTIVEPKDLDPYLFEKHVTDLPNTMEEIDQHAEEVKKGHLTRIISDSETYAQAARTLGVAPNRLHYFLNKFGLGDLL
jgi:DNA-binding NtrC family response regulator